MGVVILSAYNVSAKSISAVFKKRSYLYIIGYTVGFTGCPVLLEYWMFQSLHIAFGSKGQPTPVTRVVV